MNYHFDFIKNLVNKGGPTSEDYAELDSWLEETSDHIKSGKITEIQISELLSTLGDAATTKTLQGFVLKKPHGYAGDFEIIDKIYKKYTSQQPHLKKWDDYFHTHAATEAVRNRVHYFSTQIIEATINSKKEKTQILNLASGPGRDMLHFFQTTPDLSEKVHFDCIEQDINAIEFAKTICSAYLDKITFSQKNTLRFTTKKRYDLIWSAGLFDYFDDKIFVFLLSRLKDLLTTEGKIVIGNFYSTNPSKAYMNLFNWSLNHRSPNTLRSLAIQAGFLEKNIKIHKEPTGVNLFLHVRI